MIGMKIFMKLLLLACGLLIASCSNDEDGGGISSSNTPKATFYVDYQPVVRPNETLIVTPSIYESESSEGCSIKKVDYYWDDNRDEQRKWFEFQLDIAKQAGKPIVVHSRDAAADTLDVIKNFKTDAYGIIHCFSYGKEMAREYLNLGYYIGVGGVLTFKNAKKLKEVVEYAPLERIVLETDCPYLTPVPFRGKRNTSAYLKYVIEEMAAIKKVSEEEVIRVTRENALRAYKKGVTHGLSGKSNQDISSDKYI